MTQRIKGPSRVDLKLSANGVIAICTQFNVIGKLSDTPSNGLNTKTSKKTHIRQIL